MVLKILITTFALAGYLIPLAGLEKELWMIKQDFVKVGKKEAYEELQKEWAQKFKGFSNANSILPIYVAQDFEEPSYITLVSFENYNDLDAYFTLLKQFHDSLSSDAGKRLNILKESLLNFKIYTLQRSLMFCSYLPEGFSFLTLPHMRYFTYSIEPGNQKDFENSITQYAKQLKQKQVNYGFRAWRVLFGGDVPKYLLVFFAQTDPLAKQAANLNDLNQSLKKIIRDIKQSHGIVRKDLSVEAVNGN